MIKLFNYIVYGAGRQGVATIYDLAKNCDAKSITVVEPSRTARIFAKQRIQHLLGSESQMCHFISDDKSVDLSKHDVSISCAPHIHNPSIAWQAIQCGVPFCDLGGNAKTVTIQENDARIATTPVVPDCGISPGMSNIMAVHLAKAYGCDWLQIRCGGIPQDLVPPFYYKTFFSVDGIISEYTGDVPCIHSGDRQSIPALSVLERFDEYGDFLCSPTANNSSQSVDYLHELGVKDYNYMTIRHSGHWQYLHGHYDLSTDFGRLALADDLKNNPHVKYTMGKDKDRMILSVKGRNTNNHTYHGYSFNLLFDEDTKFSAMELTTSWGIAIVAHHLALSTHNGCNKKGFFTPEKLVHTEWAIENFLMRLRQHL